MNKKMSFEAAMERLHAVVQQLEDGSAPLDATMKLYKEGCDLTAFCYGKLRDAQQQVARLEPAAQEGEET